MGAGSTSDRTLTGFTLFRPLFDRWLADQAVAEGVTLLTDCLVDRVVVRDGAVRGVRLAGSGDVVEAPLVVACDGALSLLAKEGGLHDGFNAGQVGLGVRALYALSEEAINERFGLSAREGATSEFLGCTEGVRGGGFIYTQTGHALGRASSSTWTRSRSGGSRPTSCWSASAPRPRWPGSCAEHGSSSTPRTCWARPAWR